MQGTEVGERVFFMVVPRRPISANKKRNEKYAENIRAEAVRRMEGLAQFRGAVYSRITWFHSYKTKQDVDNIPKRLHDALKGVVYKDDVSIEACMARRVATAGNFEIRPSDRVDPEVLDMLPALLASEKDVLCVEVGPLLSHEVALGSIGGGGE